MCPCCRRDFIVDPLDLLEEENHNNSGNNPNDANESSSAGQAPPMFSWDPATLEGDANFGPIIVTAPGNGAGNFAFDPTRLEEGLNPPSHLGDGTSNSSNDANDDVEEHDPNDEAALAINATGNNENENEATSSGVNEGPESSVQV